MGTHSLVAFLHLQVSWVYIQLINNENNGAVLAERKVDDIVNSTIITITGATDDDKLTVVQSFLELGEREFVVQFDGDQGRDTLAAGSTVSTSHWQVSGEQSGSMGTNGLVECLNAEVLEATKTEES